MLQILKKAAKIFKNETAKCMPNNVNNLEEFLKTISLKSLLKCPFCTSSLLQDKVLQYYLNRRNWKANGHWNLIAFESHGLLCPEHV